MLFWIVVGIVIGFFLASGIVGYVTFPFEKFNAAREAFYNQNCIDKEGNDNGQCIIEPLDLRTFITNGLGQILSLGNVKPYEDQLKP